MSLFASLFVVALSPQPALPETVAQDGGRPRVLRDLPRAGRERPRERLDRMPRPRRGDQDFAFRAVRSGEIMSLSEIESRVVPRMRGARYIGSTFDRDSAVYTLKFMREAAVIWVEVDGRSGRVVR